MIKTAWQALPGEKKGIWLYCLAILLFSIMDIVAKDLMERHSATQVVWARYSSQFLWTVVFLAPRLSRLIKTRHLGLQLIRSACLFGGTFFFFSAMKFLELAEAVAIFNVSPLIITVLSVLILKELVGLRRWIGVICGLAGAMIIIQPGSDVFSLASLLPLCASVCFAGYAISTRLLGNDEPHATSFFYTTLIGTIAASLVVPFVWEMPNTRDMIAMSTFGVIGALGHFLLIVSLGYAAASVIAPFTYFGVLFGTLWGVLIFGEIPGISTLVGAIVIVGAGIYVWHREKSAKSSP